MATSAPIQVPNIPGRRSDEEVIIHTRDLAKEFGGTYAVQDVTFDVPRGTIFGFIGPSGAGKTTTIRMMTGVMAPSSGEVNVLGRHPMEFSQGTRARIGYMPQLFVLYPNLSVWENLNFAASIYGMKFFRREILNDVLDFVELRDHRRKLARDISGGMQRRLSLASTLVHNPDLIFLDEPTAGVDPVLRAKFWDHFRHLREEGRTLFITTQYVGEAAYCDLVAVMGHGRLLVVDTPNGLRYRAYGGEIIDLRTVDRLEYQLERNLRDMQGVKRVVRTGDNSVRLTVPEASTAMPVLIEWCRAQNMQVEAIEEFVPPYDEVFVKLVQGEPTNE